jgi:hypothetical protein
MEYIYIFHIHDKHMEYIYILHIYGSVTSRKTADIGKHIIISNLY